MNKREFIERVIREKGEEYVIAALFVDSAGYWTPEAAKNQLEFWKRGMDTCGAAVSYTHLTLPTTPYV